LGKEQTTFSPAKAGFHIAVGFPDVTLPPEIGEFTFKYRTKSRIKDSSSETGWVTKSTSSELVQHHTCSEREHNWGDSSNPI
jgi:hypothetical protein